MIKTAIPAEVQSADEKTLQNMKEALADLPYLPGGDVKEILDFNGEDEGFQLVNTYAIVGSVSPSFENWSTEYQGRKGRTVDIAKEIMEGTEESVDKVFHIKDPKQGIKLKKLSGPSGDLYFVEDSSHRVSGAKLAQLPELPAQVENVTNVSEVNTDDLELKLQWEERIKCGLIKGHIEEVATKSGQKVFKLNIESQVLPWMNLPQGKLIEVTKFYFERYPNSLDNLKSFVTGKKIPKEVLLDTIAMNYYLADRWSEYQKKQE